MTTNSTDSNRKVATWLLICCALVFAMVILGGVTRLTGSGLSMVDWRPITGILPPLSDEAWERTFEMYQESPEFQKKMSARASLTRSAALGSGLSTKTAMGDRQPC